MEYSTRSGSLATARTGCIVVGVYEKRSLSDSAKALDKATGGAIAALMRKGDITGATSQSLLVPSPPSVNADRILLVGFGKKEDADDRAFATILQTSLARLKETNARNAVLCLLERKVASRDNEWKARQIVEKFEYNLYRFTEMKGRNSVSGPALREAQLWIDARQNREQIEHAITVGRAISGGVKLARDLGNLPANICTPTYLARAARKLTRDDGRFTVRVVEEAEMKRLGMGAFLAVTAGSDQPAKLVIVQYRGARRSQKPHVIVGKGLCFDSGGISLKPGAGMGEMIYDMCGAASVLGTLHAIAELNLPINVVGALAAAENMPSGKASRPGDVVRTLSGQTVEISNTDAEGRLVLCDTLTYIDRFKPETVVDIATLTGACVIALGNHATGLMSNDDRLAQDLLHAGEYTTDRAWRLPIWEEYQAQLASPSADMNNVGGRPAGTITAGCFLARYTKKYRWAHLDIAGTGYVGGPRRTATGRPVSLLTQYLIDRTGQ